MRLAWKVSPDERANPPQPLQFGLSGVPQHLNPSQTMFVPPGLIPFLLPHRPKIVMMFQLRKRARVWLCLRSGGRNEARLTLC